MEATDNPYVGPRPFQREEQDRFFGREREARDLLSLVISERLVLFYAQSGAGKTSLINTRLIPGLEARGFEVLPVGRVSGDLPPGVEAGNIFALNLMLKVDTGEDNPARFAGLRLADFLGELVVCSTDDGYRCWQYAPAPAADQQPEERLEEQAGHEAEVQAGDMPPRALIIDQFEELFTTHPEAWRKREAFLRQLAEAMEEDPFLWVALAMREDYIAGLDPYVGLLPGGLRARYSMQRLGEAAALEAVMQPVAALRPFERDAAANLVANLSRISAGRNADGTPLFVAGEYVEPVQLQVVCYQLWEALRGQPGERITQEDINRLARGRSLAEFVNRALADFYSQAVQRVAATPGLDVSERRLREWFAAKLITEARTRGFVFMGEQTTGGIPNDAVILLEGQLLRGENRAGGRWYELVHDRFIEPILQSNREWAAERSRAPRMASFIGVGLLAAVALGFGLWAAFASRQALAHADQSTQAAITAMAANVSANQSQILAQTAQAQSDQAEAIARAAWTAEAQRRYGLVEATSTIQALEVASTAQAVKATLQAVQVGMPPTQALLAATPTFAPTPSPTALVVLATYPPLEPPPASMAPRATATLAPGSAPTKTLTFVPRPTLEEPLIPAPGGEQQATASALQAELDGLYATQTAIASPVRRVTYGNTARGTPLEAVQLGTGPRSIILVGGLHSGFAPSTVDLAGQISAYFEQRQDEIPPEVSLHVIMNANPDAELAPGRTAGRLNANGVDLNRNWDCEWQATSFFRNTTVSGGTAPFSELETQALRDYFERTQPAAVVVWTARAPNGEVNPGGCGQRSLFSEALARIYGGAARYPISEFVAYAVNGDITNWLDRQGIPAIFVNLLGYETPDFDSNLRAVKKLLEVYGQR